MVRNVKFNTVKLAQDLGVSEVVAKLLVNRGIYNLDIAKEFLNSSIIKRSVSMGTKSSFGICLCPF